MAQVQKAAFVPAAIHAQNGRIPDLFVTSGEVGVRGYAARFFNVEGELIKPSATQNLTCYALNLTTEKAYYTEGTYADNTWYIEVPRQAVESDGRVAIQLALKEGDTALLITDTSVVDVHNFLGGDSSRPLDADNGILMDYQKLHAQAEAAAAALDAVTATANRAEALQKQAREDITKIEAKEASRNSAESARVSAESARAQAESARKAQEEARVRAESGRASVESARVSAEKSRATVESARASAETGRVNAEKMRADKETARQSTESARVEAEKKRATAESARASAESTRASQESTRQANENTRKAQETARQNAESSRVSAEEKRKQTFDGWDKTMQGVIQPADATSVGVVKAKGTAQESAPYTVPSMGVLDEELKKAGKVKSVNGMTGDVTVPKYTLPQATGSTLGGVKIRSTYVKGASSSPQDATDAATVKYVTGKVDDLAQSANGIYAKKSDISSATPSKEGMVKILENTQSSLYQQYKGTAAGVSHVDGAIKNFEVGLHTQLDLKQDKIKQVTSIPTAETTTNDPDGTVYAVIPDDGQQGGAVGALTMADVEQMGLPVADGYVYKLEESNKYLLLKDFTLKEYTRSDVLKPGFYTAKRDGNSESIYNLSNDINRAQFQYYDGKSFVRKKISGTKTFFELFRDGGFLIDYRDVGPIEGITIADYAESTDENSFMSSYSRVVAVNGMVFEGIDKYTLFPGSLIVGSGSSSEIGEFTITAYMAFLESIKKDKTSGKITYGYRKIESGYNASPHKKTAHCLLSAYHPKSPIYIKSGTGVEPPKSLYIKRNGKIVKL